MNFIIGSRGSKLSQAQTSWVISELQKIDPLSSFEIKPITTKGDTDTRPLFAMEQKGVFEKEIDRAVFEKEVDFAVHSLKDVPSELDSNLTIACIPKREAINDVLITKDGFDIDSIPSNSVIGIAYSLGLSQGEKYLYNKDCFSYFYSSIYRPFNKFFYWRSNFSLGFCYPC